MKALLVVLGLLSATVHKTTAQSCPKGRIGDRYTYAYTLVRFVYQGRIVEHFSTLATYDSTDKFIEGALRFGAFYMVRTKGFYTRPTWIHCAVGRDTMHVLVSPYYGVSSIENNTSLVDSVPFHPGFYTLEMIPPYRDGGAPPLPIKGARRVSLVSYYSRYATALTQNNPLAGYCFPESMHPQQGADGSFPLTPAGLFADAFHRPCYLVTKFYRLTPIPDSMRATVYPPPAGGTL